MLIQVEKHVRTAVKKSVSNVHMHSTMPMGPLSEREVTVQLRKEDMLLAHKESKESVSPSQSFSKKASHSTVVRRSM